MINVKSRISSNYSRNYFSMDHIKKWFSASNFEEALVPVRYLGLCFGVMPFNFVLKRRHIKAVINIPSAVVAFFGFTFYLYCVWKVMACDELNEETDGKFGTIQSVSSFFCVLAGIIAMVFIFFLTFSSRHADAKTIELLKEIDEVFNKLNEKKDFSNILLKTMGRLGLFYVTQITLVCVNLYFMSTSMLYKSHEMGVAVYAPSFICSTILIIFRTIVSLLNENTAVLNRLLRKMLTEPNQRILEPFPKVNLIGVLLKEPLYNIYLKPQDNSKRLEVLFKINDKICDCIENINTAYGFKNLVIITLAFVSNVFYVFNVLATIVSSQGKGFSKSDILYLYFSLSQLGLYTFVLYGTISGCEECQTKSKETASLVSKLSMQEEDEKVKHLLLQFSVTLLNRPPKFSALGVFTLDATLLLSMVATTTTYLIILIQFTITFLE